MRKAEANTYLAGDGRLVSKIYPFPVNFRTSTGAFAPINARLARSGSGYVQRANDLGLRLPAAASGAVRLRNRGGSIAFSLAGARGHGAVAGSSERFGTAVPGASLSYRSMNTGVLWQAALSKTGLSRGLRWFVRRSRGLSVHLQSGAVVFRNHKGRIVWVLSAPIAHLNHSMRLIKLHVRLSRAKGGVLITIKPVALPRVASARQGSRAASNFSANVTGVPLGGNGQAGGYPAYMSTAGFPGDYYADGPNLGHSGDTTGDCSVDSTAPTTSLCNGASTYVGPHSHTLLNFAVAENLPSHVQVLQAYVGMKLTSESTTTSEQVGVWQSAKPWNNLATWNTYDGTNAWSTPGGDTTGAMADQHPRGASGDVGSWYWWDIDSAMQGWLDGNPQAVDGVEFQATQGGSAPNTLGFATNTSASDYPYIFVYYQPRIGDYPGSHYNSQSLTDRTTLGVNVASGNMMLANNDIHLAGTNGLDLNIGRYYNDLSSDLNSFGQGWTMGVGADTYLAIPSDTRNTVVFSDGTGDLQTYHQDANGNWVYPPGTDVSLTMNGTSTSNSTQYTLLFRHSGITEKFSTALSNPVHTLVRLSTLSDRNGNTLHYYYNTSNQLTSIVDTHGNTTTIAYSSAGYISQITDPTGRTYQYGQNSSNQLTTYTDPAGKVTQYAYDAYGNLTKITTAQDPVTKITYDAGNTNRVTSVARLLHPTDSTGPSTSYSYAAASGRCPTNNGWMQTTLTDPNSHVSTYCTDDLGRIVKSVDANGHTRSTSYSPTGYVGSLTSGLGTPTTFTYSTDGKDNVSQIQQGSGSGSLSTGLQYNDSANQYLPTQSTDAQSHNTNYTYDTNGNLKTLTDQLGTQNQSTLTYNTDGTVATSTDADGNQTTYHYTGGNLTSVVPPSGAGLNTITLTYDSANRAKMISSVSGGSGHEIDYSYDAFDRVTQEIFKNASGATTATITYSYDNNGKLTSRTDSHGTTSYTYDDLNRLVTQTFPDLTTDTYGYDSASNLTSLQDAGGTVTYGYDPANQLTSITDPGASSATTLGYDNDGNLATVTYPSGAAVVRAYNDKDQLKSVTDSYKTGGGSTAQLSYTYTYGGSLRSTVTDQAGNVTTYTYDALNRLTEAKTANSGGTTTNDQTYSIDGAGNIKTAILNGSTTNYTYNSGNEIQTAGGHTYSYDGDGNETSNGNNWSATYNALGQMTSTTAGTTTASYSYLGDNQRELITDGTNPLHNDLLGLASKQAGTGTNYYTRAVSGQPMSERTSLGIFNYLYDGTGSVVGLTDSSGHLANQYAYGPYGTRTSASGTTPNSIGFQGGNLLDVGLNHYGARFLAPSDQRWTQEDPLHQIESLTAENRSAFVGDDPINQADPTGKMTFCGSAIEGVGVQGCLSVGSSGVHGSISAGVGLKDGLYAQSGEVSSGPQVGVGGCLTVCGSTTTNPDTGATTNSVGAGVAAGLSLTYGYGF